MRQFFLVAVLTVIFAPNFVFADEAESNADLDFYHGQVLFEHELCGIKYVVDQPEIDHLYINDELVAAIDYRGEIGKAIDTLSSDPVGIEINGTTDPVYDYLDSVLQKHGLPLYGELTVNSCLIG
jgi:hypothetical protein